MVTWYKDGEPVNEKVVGVRNSTVDSILFIRSAEREHSGKYELVVQIENMEDRATIDIRVVGTNAGSLELIPMTIHSDSEVLHRP